MDWLEKLVSGNLDNMPSAGMGGLDAMLASLNPPGLTAEDFARFPSLTNAASLGLGALPSLDLNPRAQVLENNAAVAKQVIAIVIALTCDTWEVPSTHSSLSESLIMQLPSLDDAIQHARETARETILGNNRHLRHQISMTESQAESSGISGEALSSCNKLRYPYPPGGT